MTSFIELTIADTKILLNVNHIVRVSPAAHDEDEDELLNSLEENDEWGEMLEMFGGAIKKTINKATEQIKNAKTVIAVTETDDNGKSKIYYITEDYPTVKKLIREAIT